MADNTTKMVAGVWSVTAIALFFLLSRIAFKWRSGKRIGADDWILATSWCLLAIYASLIHVATSYGLGYHLADIAETNLPYALKYLTIGEFFVIIALQVSKTSFAVTLLRLVARTWQTWALWAIIVSLNVVMGLDAIFVFVSCNPTAKIWRSELPGHCWNPRDGINVSIFAGVYSGVMDLVLAAFPVVLLQPLKIDKKEKIGVSIAMSLGVFAGIAAFIKSAYLPQLGRWKDVTYSSYIILIWAAAEAAITIVATSIPYLRLAVIQSKRQSRGYRVHDEELHMDRVTPKLKSDITVSTLTDKKRIAIPDSVKRNANMKSVRLGQTKEQERDTWDKYTDQLSRGSLS